MVMSAQKGRLLGWFDRNQLSACLKFTESSYLKLLNINIYLILDGYAVIKENQV